MDPTFQVGTDRIVFTIIAIVLEIALPLGLVLFVRRHLNAGWRYVAYGALIFTVFQLLTRVPAVTVLQTLFAAQLQESSTFRWVWVAALVLTSGLFEEVGRYVGYRWLMRREPKTWSKGVMYGLGHGGIESVVLVAGITLLGLINLLVLPSVMGTLPPEQQQLANEQLAAVAAQPAWLALVGVYERFWSILVHVGLSVVVLQVFVRGGLRWLWLSVGLHALLNAVSFVSLLGLGQTATLLISEGWVTLFGLGALWLIFRLRTDEA